MASSACRSCGAPVFWLLTERGKRIPIDDEPVEDGNIVIRWDWDKGENVAHYVGKDEEIGSDEERYVSHFATCPQSKNWRKPTHERG